MFIDEVEIYVKAGKGGDGVVSFRHEKFIPKGGPDGGDGGRGGDIIFEIDNQAHGLSAYNQKKRFLAEDGHNGASKKKSGRKGENLILGMPPGTQILEKDELILDMKPASQPVVIVKGGRGGWGNQHFATSIKQAPEWSKMGERGEGKKFRLILKIIADVGLVGLPNSGKSTLLSVLTSARPKIADYPFTTLVPNIGTYIDNESRIIFADVPGLIEGASAGKGLGYRFLKHIERTCILVHLIDATADDTLKSYDVVRTELSRFSKEILKKREIVVINKADQIDRATQTKIVKKFSKRQIVPFIISSATGQGVKELIQTIKKELQQAVSG